MARVGVVTRAAAVEWPVGVRGRAARAAEHLSIATINTLLLRGVGPVSSFLLTVLLARALGPDGTGAFFVALTLTTLAALVAKSGLDTGLQRFVSVAAAAADGGHAARLHTVALRLAGGAALAAALLVLLVAEPLAARFIGSPDGTFLLQALALALVPLTLLGIHASMLKGLGRPGAGGFFETSAVPLLALAGAAPILLRTQFDLTELAGLYAIAAWVAMLLARGAVRRALPASSGYPRRHPALPAGACVQFAIIELMNFALLWSPFLALALLGDTAEAGRYNVAHRVAALLGVLTLAVASVAAPRFAALHAADDGRALAATASRATRVACLLGAPAAALVVLWPELVLSMFGTSFTGAAETLRVLGLGQLFNLATGPGGYLLAMTGHERALRNAVLVALLLTMSLSVALIPNLGATGAALAVSVPMALHNVVCATLAARRLHVPLVLLAGTGYSRRQP